MDMVEENQPQRDPAKQIERRSRPVVVTAGACIPDLFASDEPAKF
jgi:hypothetical protein